MYADWAQNTCAKSESSDHVSSILISLADLLSLNIRSSQPNVQSHINHALFPFGYALFHIGTRSNKIINMHRIRTTPFTDRNRCTLHLETKSFLAASNRLRKVPFHFLLVMKRKQADELCNAHFGDHYRSRSPKLYECVINIYFSLWEG